MTGDQQQHQGDRATGAGDAHEPSAVANFAAEVHGRSEWLTADGDLRTLPCHLGDPDSRMGGLDGFYAARLQRI